MAPTQTRKIALVGASGTVGKPILDAMLATGHDVTIITRKESTGTFPDGLTVHRGSYVDEAFLETCMQGRDVLVVALAFTQYESMAYMYRAAARAGVPWIVPCEFGSDVDAPLNERLGLMKAKAPYRKLIEELGVASWVGFVTNPWYDYVLPLGWLGPDLKARTVNLLGDGRVKANFTTLRRTGEGVAAVLALPDAELAAYRNGWVHLSSFYVSQRDIFESVLRVTGTAESDWKVTSQPAEEVAQALGERASKGDVRAGAQMLLAFTLTEGMGGDYNSRVIDNAKLGLAPEDLDEVTKSVADKVLSG